jgi:hypothetical protein
LGQDKKFNDKRDRSIKREEKIKEREMKYQEAEKRKPKDHEAANLEFFAEQDETVNKSRGRAETHPDPDYILPDYQHKKRKPNPVLEIPRGILSNNLIVECLIRNKISNYSAVDLMATIIGVCGGNVDDFHLSEGYARKKVDTKIRWIVSSTDNTSL